MELPGNRPYTQKQIRLGRAVFSVGCRSPFMRFAEHLATRFAELGSSKQKSAWSLETRRCSVSALCVEMRGYMVIRLLPCMISKTPLHCLPWLHLHASYPFGGKQIPQHLEVEVEKWEPAQ